MFLEDEATAGEAGFEGTRFEYQFRFPPTKGNRCVFLTVARLGQLS
jgi:hypothetical protein